MQDLTSFGPLPNALNWIGFWLTILGVLVSAIGLTATFKQARDARRTAAEARDVAREAIRQLKERNLFARLSRSIEQVRLVRLHLTRREFGVAQARFDTCSQEIKEVALGLRLEDRLDPADGAITIFTVLKDVSAVLDLPAPKADDVGRAVRLLGLLSEKMSTDAARRGWPE